MSKLKMKPEDELAKQEKGLYTKQREELCEGQETKVCYGCGIYQEEDLGAGGRGRTREEAAERGVVQAIEGFVICAKNIGVLF